MTLGFEPLDVFESPNGLVGKTSTFEHFSARGPDTRMGKTAPIKVQSLIKLRTIPEHPKIFKYLDARLETNARTGKAALGTSLKALSA